jgi:transposase
MGQNFIGCDREQELLLPPSLREWLPANHLAWFVLDAVDAIDLKAFYAAYRSDGWGRAAFEPSMMVALTVYAYCVGERASRAIERRCHEDVAFRVICGHLAVPGPPRRGDRRPLRRGVDALRAGRRRFGWDGRG